MLRNRRDIALALLTGAAAITLAACGSSASNNAAPSSSAAVSSSAAPTGAAATTADGSTTASASGGSTAPTTAGASPVSSAGGSSPACAESQLKASTTDVILNSAGQRGVLVLFLNTSAQPCTLTGYPGAAIVSSAGAQVKQATRSLRGPLGGMPVGATTYTPVPLAPGASAQAELEGVSTKQVGAAQAGCDDAPFPSILVTPPNTTIPVPFNVSWPICESFEVHPVRPVS